MRSPEEFKKKQGIDVFLRHHVTRVDPGGKRIEVEDLERGERRVLDFDKAVLACGARSRRLGIPGEGAANLFTLKDLGDAIRVKQYLDRRQPGRVGILGSGYIALEMAEAFRERGLDTTIFYRGTRPVSHLEPEIGERVLKELEDNGVRFLAEHEPVALHTNGGDEIAALETSKGRYPVDLVLSALGVVPNAEIAGEAGLRLGRTGAIWTDPGQRTETVVYESPATTPAFTPLDSVDRREVEAFRRYIRTRQAVLSRGIEAIPVSPASGDGFDGTLTRADLDDLFS